MDLKQYVADVERLEKEKYAYEQIIGNIDKRIRELEKTITVYRSRNPVPEEEMTINQTQGGLILAAIILVIIGLVYCGKDLGWIIACIFWFIALLLGGGVFLSISRARKEYYEYQQLIEKEYREAEKRAKMQEYDQKQMAAHYRQARNKMYNTYVQICNLLKQMYAKNIIAEEYRYDIAAICTFSQYLRSRKCFTLEGHEGAYLLYEEEKFRGRVLGKLDEIIAHLDRIEQNQYGIVMALREINNTQNRILNNLHVISQRQEQQLENAEYMRYDLEVLRTNSDIAMIYGIRYI